MNIGYKNYDGEEPYTDAWRYTDHSGTGYSDRARHPVIVDADGRKHPIINYASGTEGYVIKHERIIEHISLVAPVTEYRYSFDQDLADHRRHGQLGPVYNHPEKVGEFLTKVQNEASRPVTSVSGPFSSNWRAHPNSAGKDHAINNKNYADDSNDFQDKQNKAYPEFYTGTNPRSKYGPVMPSHPLSKPTNNIDTAVDFLANAVEPNYETNTQTDVSRPPKAGPLIHQRTGLNSAAQDRKLGSGEDDWAKLKGQPMYGRDNHKNEKFLEPTSPINNKEGYGRANDNGSSMYFGKPAPFPVTMQNRETNSSHQPVIDSSEARKPNGKLKSQPVPGTIDSNTLVEKYKGAKVPR